MKSKICAYAMLLLALAQIVLVLMSWLITAAMPDAFPRSMLSPEGIRWFFGSFTENMESPWLVGLLLICIAWGTLQTSGLLHFDRTIYRVEHKALPFSSLREALSKEVESCLEEEERLCHLVLKTGGPLPEHEKERAAPRKAAQHAQA